MSKYVESWWVEELPNGVIHLLINCTQREIYFHGFSETQFLIAGSQEEYDNFNIDCILKIEPFLPKTVWMYLHTTMKEKEQLSFYYIPYERHWNKNRKIIAQSEDYGISTVDKE